MAKRKKKAAKTTVTAKPVHASLDDFRNFLRSHVEVCEFNGCVGSSPKFPTFDLLPHDYLEYANEALSQPTDANKINCISHLKRAAECQADTFLHVLALYGRPQTRNFPAKMKFITQLDLLPSRSIAQLNRIRNKMEHEYAVPEIDDLELYFDLVAGFVSAIEGALFMLAWCGDMDFGSCVSDRDVRFTASYDSANPSAKCEMRHDEGHSTFTAKPDDWDSFTEALRIFILLARYTQIVSSNYVLQHLVRDAPPT